MIYQLGCKVKYFYNEAAFSGILVCINKPFPKVRHKHLQNFFTNFHGKKKFKFESFIRKYVYFKVSLRFNNSLSFLPPFEKQFLKWKQGNQNLKLTKWSDWMSYLMVYSGYCESLYISKLACLSAYNRTYLYFLIYLILLRFIITIFW